MTEWQLPAALLLKLLIDLSLKGSVMLLLAFVTVRALRRASADQRHTTLTLIFHGLLLLPLLLPVHPLWQLPLLPVEWSGFAWLLSLPASTLTPAAYGPQLLVIVWSLGFVWVLARLAAGLLTVAALRRASKPLEETRWHAAMADVCRRVGVSEPARLLEHPSLPTALAIGIWRPAIILPAAARHWPAGRRDAILTHEMVHHRRRDNLTNLVVEIVCAFHWFNPLVWWASRQLRADRERACDDAVLRCGTRPSDYVESLLSFVPRRRTLQPSLEVGQASSLKVRLRAILDPAQRRTPVGWLRSLSHLVAVTALIGCLALLDLWLPAALTDGARTPLEVLTRMASTEAADRSGAGALSDIRLQMSRLDSERPTGHLPQRSSMARAPGPSSRDLRPLAAPPARRGRIRVAPAERPLVASPRGRFLSALPAARTQTVPGADQPAVPPDSGTESVFEIDLGTLGGESTTAVALNDEGQVIGASTTPEGRKQPFVWSLDDGMRALEVAGAGDDSVSAVALNNRGDVLLQVDSHPGCRTTYLWGPETGAVSIGSLGDGTTEGVAVNDAGHIAGRAELSPGRMRAFFWSPDDGMINLGGREAVAVNASGMVVARADSFSFAWHSETGFTRIGDVGVKAIPFDVNDRGQVVGSATTAGDPAPRAFIWSASDGFVDLGQLLGPDRTSVAYRINDAGQVVGVARRAVPLASTTLVGEEETSFLWSPQDGLLELDARVVPGVVLNNLGQLVGRLPIPVGTSQTSALFWSRDLGAVQLLRRDLEANLRAEPVALNDRGQIVGNLISVDRRQSRALLWELRLAERP